MALHDALEDLAAQDERKARIVELRFFAGLTVDETAAARGPQDDPGGQCERGGRPHEPKSSNAIMSSSMPMSARV